MPSFNLFFLQSYAPELYLLEVENRDDENETTGSTRPTTRSPQFTESKTHKFLFLFEIFLKLILSDIF